MKYPVAFISRFHCILVKHPDQVSRDGTPRYIINPNSQATYCLQECMAEFTPIWSEDQLQAIKLNTDNKTDNKMNGHHLNPAILNTHLDFLRKQKSEYLEKRDHLRNSPGVKSDDAVTLLRGYETIIKEINYLISYSYDCEK